MSLSNADLKKVPKGLSLSEHYERIHNSHKKSECNIFAELSNRNRKDLMNKPSLPAFTVFKVLPIILGTPLSTFSARYASLNLNCRRHIIIHKLGDVQT